MSQCPQQVTQSRGPSWHTLQYLQCSEGKEHEEQYEHHLQFEHSLHFVDHGQRFLHVSIIQEYENK